MSSGRHGCLVIADIGGYTRYLSGVELEHSTDVLADLLETVVKALEPSYRIAKLEGDAVFAYDDRRADGAVVVDALTGAYIAFMRRRRTVVQLNTCPCAFWVGYGSHIDPYPAHNRPPRRCASHAMRTFPLCERA